MWIKVDPLLIDHRKTFIMAEYLEIKEAQAVGHLVSFWGWAINNCPSGVLPNSTRMIARACHWDEKPEKFMTGLIAANFIDEYERDDGEMELRIHGWDEYAGALLRNRAANANRMKEARAKKTK